MRRQLPADRFARYLGQQPVVQASEAAQQPERRVRRDAEPCGQGPLGLLDGHPAVERALKLLGSLGTATQGPLLQDGDGRRLGQDLGQVDLGRAERVLIGAQRGDYPDRVVVAPDGQ